MRTTLSLDDDMLFAVKERARREHRSAGAVLSDLARQALTHQHQAGQSTETEEFHGFQPLPHRGTRSLTRSSTGSAKMTLREACTP